MVMLHYQFPLEHIDYSNIVERLQNPIWKGIEILFLFFVMIHALTGSYVVLTDYEKVARFEKAIAIVLLLAGIVAFYWGTVTVLSWQPPV
jgi:succinate dehydrogenase hydrophobic anchor subunit